MKQIFIVLTFITGNYLGYGQSTDSLRVVELDKASPLFATGKTGTADWSLTLNLISRQQAPPNISSQYYSFPFRNPERFGYYGFTENQLKYVYTTKGITDLLTQKLTLHTIQILDTLDTEIENLSKQIDSLPCNLLLDEKSPCYKTLVEKIILEIEKKYVLTPKNQ